MWAQGAKYLPNIFIWGFFLLRLRLALSVTGDLILFLAFLDNFWDRTSQYVYFQLYFYEQNCSFRLLFLTEAPGPILVSTIIWFFGASCSVVIVEVKTDPASVDGSALIGCKTVDVESPIAKTGTPPGEYFRGFDSTTWMRKCILWKLVWKISIKHSGLSFFMYLLYLALGQFTSCCSCQTACWRPSCCWLGWVIIRIGNGKQTVFDDFLSDLKAHYYNVHLTHLGPADSCIATEIGIFLFFALYTSALPTSVKHISSEWAFKEFGKNSWSKSNRNVRK